MIKKFVGGIWLYLRAAALGVVALITSGFVIVQLRQFTALATSSFIVVFAVAATIVSIRVSKVISRRDEQSFQNRPCIDPSLIIGLAEEPATVVMVENKRDQVMLELNPDNAAAAVGARIPIAAHPPAPPPGVTVAYPSRRRTSATVTGG